MASPQRQVGAFEDCRQRDASSCPTQAHRGRAERRKFTGFGPEDRGEILPLPLSGRKVLGKVSDLGSQGLGLADPGIVKTHLAGLLRGLREMTRAKLPEQFLAQ